MDPDNGMKFSAHRTRLDWMNRQSGFPACLQLEHGNLQAPGESASTRYEVQHLCSYNRKETHPFVTPSHRTLRSLQFLHATIERFRFGLWSAPAVLGLLVVVAEGWNCTAVLSGVDRDTPLRLWLLSDAGAPLFWIT